METRVLKITNYPAASGTLRLWRSPPTTSYKLLTKRGFTLVELLVSIAVISVLAVVMAVVVNPGKKKAQARDASRKSGIAQISSALATYSVQTDSYPAVLTDLVPGELKSLVKDPNGTNFSYSAQSQDGGVCTTENRDCLKSVLYAIYEFPNNPCTVGSGYWAWTSSSLRTGKVCTESSPTYSDTPIDD